VAITLLQRIIRKIKTIRTKIFNYYALTYYSHVFHPLILRNNTTDTRVFNSIFVMKEFELPRAISPKCIIDGGAYTGLSTLFFARKYPKAKIIAVEPEPSNFAVLEQHTVSYPTISRIQAGLWNKDAQLKIVDRGLGKWGFAVEEIPDGSAYDVCSVTLNSLLQQSGCDRIDILKLDIEGAEWELFSENFSAWLDKTDCIIIELHDRFKAGCSEKFYAAIDPAQWDRYVRGEKVIVIRKNKYSKFVRLKHS